MAAGPSLTEHLARSSGHCSFYLAGGEEGATPIIFVHGWPELSISWRGQLPVFAGLGFRSIAPDMRGYGRSSVPPRREDYALELIVGDMIELLDSIEAPKAIWVGHDWGAPVVWSIAQHHPERCHGVANLCVPYIPEGFAVRTILPLADRNLYPEDKFPFAQWDYQIFYEENFERASSGFEADVRSTVRALFRAGDPAGRGKPNRLAFVRARGGWFGAENKAPAVPRDERVIGEEDEDRYVAALSATICRSRQLVHERGHEHRLCRTGSPELAPDDAGSVFARRVRLYLRDAQLTAGRADARPLRQPDRDSRSLGTLDGAGKARFRTPLSPNGSRKSCPRFGSPPDAQRTVTMARDAFASFGSHPNQSAFRSCGELLGQ